MVSNHGEHTTCQQQDRQYPSIRPEMLHAVIVGSATTQERLESGIQPHVEHRELDAKRIIFSTRKAPGIPQHRNSGHTLTIDSKRSKILYLSQRALIRSAMFTWSPSLPWIGDKWYRARDLKLGLPLQHLRKEPLV